MVGPMMTLRSSDTKQQGGSDERGYTNRYRPGKEHFSPGGYGRRWKSGVAQGAGAAQAAGVPGAAKGGGGGDGGLRHGALLGREIQKLGHRVKLIHPRFV